MYRNEDAVGQAVKESGLKREEIFVSKCGLGKARVGDLGKGINYFYL